MEFFLPCIPPTTSHHQKKIMRIGRVRLGLRDTPKLVAAKDMLDVLLLPHRPAEPIRGFATLTLEYTWPWRSNDSRRVRALGRVPRGTRPDCSNLAKTTEDRLVAQRFLEDDGQVVELIVRKFFGDQPGIRVRLAEYSTVEQLQQVLR